MCKWTPGKVLSKNFLRTLRLHNQANSDEKRNFIDKFFAFIIPAFYLPLEIERKTKRRVRVACGETIIFVVFVPHRFALSDNAFRLLIEENRSQCILIAGESSIESILTTFPTLNFLPPKASPARAKRKRRRRFCNSLPPLPGTSTASSR